MNNKKYELTGETIEFNGRILHRIKALEEFADVEKDELGGYIENENNLSHEGFCWVYDNAKIYDDAQVSDEAQVYGNAQVYEQARIYGDCQVHGNSMVYGNAEIHGFAKIYDNACISENSSIFGDSKVSGNSYVHGEAKVHDFAIVTDHAEILENANISGKAIILGPVVIGHNGFIASTNNYITVGPVDGVGYNYITFYKDINNNILVSCNQYYNCTIDEFDKKLIEKYDSKYSQLIKFIKAEL